IPHTGQSKNLFRNLTRNQPETPRPRQNLHSDTTRLARDIERDSMLRSTTTLPAPAAPPDRNDVQLRLHSPLVDRCPDLARLPLADADTSVTITDGQISSEPVLLPSDCPFPQHAYPTNHT